METKTNKIQENLRPEYDFYLPSLTDTSNSRGLVFNAIASGSRVLDVGCDTGRFGEVLRNQKHCIVDGIEPFSQAAQAAASRLNRVFIQPVENENSFESFKNYDAILFLDVLEHLVDPWSVLQGANKTLRAGGKIYVIVPNIAHISIIRRLMRGEFEYCEHGSMDRTHLRWFTRKSIKKDLENAGFINVEVQGVFQIPYIRQQFLISSLGKMFPDLISGSLFGCGQKPDQT